MQQAPIPRREAATLRRRQLRVARRQQQRRPRTRSTGARPPAGSCPPDPTHRTNRQPARPTASQQPSPALTAPKEVPVQAPRKRSAWEQPAGRTAPAGWCCCSDAAARCPQTPTQHEPAASVQLKGGTKTGKAHGGPPVRPLKSCRAEQAVGRRLPKQRTNTGGQDETTTAARLSTSPDAVGGAARADDRLRRRH